MSIRKSIVTACAAVAAGLVMAGSIQALEPVSQINHLTFSQAVALPGVVLPPGTYTFQAGPDGRSPELVIVRTRDGKGLFLGLTRQVSRPAGMPSSRTVTFGEAAAGEPTPIAAWFLVGSSTGHQFLYR
ncbi:MAG: hypothetical protein HY657_19565 [Acidobacteria bacterium]|nr:hypothetical protein [Acidobacteriota bacterium]